ncbi:MAG: putative transporter protein family [Clostridiaceae bacterium]|jgi:MFS family permease|nr:putative transporter protein family [Clostridiaceae bacterium]
MKNEIENKSIEDRIDKLNRKENLERKLWNRNFILIIQGQLVSIFGDNIYEIALGFWILAITGSTALMGTIMAAAVLPKIFISPFAGTFIDRHHRRNIMIITDVVRGILILFIGIAAVMGFIQIWMIIAIGIIVGICGCFFSPAINSVIPDIVSKSKLIKANSILSLVSTANYMVGNAAGGFMVQILGAPIIFIINGVSFLFSATAEFFVKIPPVESTLKNMNFFEDMKAGIDFVKNSKGLKYLFITICFFNSFASMSMTLTLPWFKMNKQLGLTFYGIAMAINAFGMLIGFTALSSMELKKEKRFFVFISSGVLLSITMIIYSLTLNRYLIGILFFIDGFCISVVNSLIQSSIQINVHSSMRAKAFALKDMLTYALVPLSMIIAGILAEKIKINIIIMVDYVVFLIIFVLLLFVSSVKEMMNT